MRYEYATQGTCSQVISFDIEGDVISNIEFYGGCNGNLKAISKLLDGQTVDFIEGKLLGRNTMFRKSAPKGGTDAAQHSADKYTCGRRPTSCADQLAKAVREAYNKSVVSENG